MATKAEQADALEVWNDILVTYAPGAVEKIQGLKVKPGTDEVLAVGDNLVRVFATDDGGVDFGIRSLAAGGLPIGSRPLPSTRPPASGLPSALTNDLPRAFSGVRDFNTPKFQLAGGDYHVKWSADGGTGCFVAFDLKSADDTFDVAAEIVTGRTGRTTSMTYRQATTSSRRKATAPGQ